MALTSMVKVLEECRISPPAGSVSTTSLPLTFFDLIFLKIPPVQRLFFFEFNHPKTHFMTTILPNIKHSLSLALQPFYPLAGHITWPQESDIPEILYTDGDSICLTVAESDNDFYHLSGNHPRDANEFYPLVPNFEQIQSSDKLVPILALKITLFPDKGLCIGVTINHIAADGRTSNQFMKTWASISRLHGHGHNTSLPTELTQPLYDRTIINHPKEIEQIRLDILAKVRATKNASTFSAAPLVPVSAGSVRATFVMGRSDVIKLKQWILTRLHNEKQIPAQLHLSTFVVTCAYVWVCLVKARIGNKYVANVSETEDQKEYFAFAMDCRDQLSPPVPVTYFGNCLGFCMATSNRKDLIQEDGIATAAELLGKTIQIARDPATVWELMARRFSNIFSIDLQCVVSIAGSPKLNVYKTDFGWGKPNKVEVISIEGTGAISISEHTKEEGALEVGLVRNKKEMDAFSSLFLNHINSLPKM
ncbi:hypothetical protein AQUCO_03400344v1 [Aquilegia coerulea]|uniref:Uncharacterized protein n=1 Tax=Aquilegia coerulea TaxID=218851 RepID=A0A2G5CYP9_AQUCA|nr:hypothetical protein AQUCO_03400344v1 [Aquilegia coerulea]